MEEIISTVTEAFKAKIDQELEMSGLAEDQKNMLRNKYMTTFQDNLKFGISKTFGATETTHQEKDQGASEVSPEDIDELDAALHSAVSRRARYPAKCARLTEMALLKKEEIFKCMQTDISTNKTVLRDADPAVIETQQQLLNNATDTLKESVEFVDQAMTKAINYGTALKIVNSNLATD